MYFLGRLSEQSKEEGLLERIKFLWNVFFGLKGYRLKMLEEDKASLKLFFNHCGWLQL